MLIAMCRHKIEGRLPQVLYLQLDNCWPENKNAFVLGMLAYIVKRKYVKEVRTCGEYVHREQIVLIHVYLRCEMLLNT
jgi:hypothetical protein